MTQIVLCIGIEIMSLDDFNRWKVDSLKKFLRARGQPVGCKKKAELVALAFAASQQGIPVVPTEAERKECSDIEYSQLLTVVVDELQVTVPDPSTVLDGWIDEPAGIKLWPPCAYTNIAQYLVEHDERDLLTRLGNDYKEGKLL